VVAISLTFLKGTKRFKRLAAAVINEGVKPDNLLRKADAK
jgi:hypothetical protein